MTDQEIEKMVEILFNENMTSGKCFKWSYRTIYNKIIVPAVAKAHANGFKKGFNACKKELTNND